MPKLIGGRYEIIATLGRGGMATVHRARDARLLRDVAVKVLEHDHKSRALFYFHREARAIASLSHPNIVQIHDYSGSEETPAFIVMQLVEGDNLERAFRKLHPIPEAVLSAIAKQIAAALDHAHNKGVVHRDLKPANVMIEASGRVLLTDFGLAKGYRDDDLLGTTFTGKKTQLFGTPDFMAPEQLRDREHGPHTDMFSFGTLLYYLAADKLPFYHPDVVTAMRRILEIDFEPLAVDRPDLSPGFVQIIESCFAKRPADRPTAGAVVGSLSRLLATRAVSAPDEIIHGFLERFRRGAQEEAETIDESQHARDHATRQRDAERRIEAATTEPLSAETPRPQAFEPTPVTMAEDGPAPGAHSNGRPAKPAKPASHVHTAPAPAATKIAPGAVGMAETLVGVSGARRSTTPPSRVPLISMLLLAVLTFGVAVAAGLWIDAGGCNSRPATSSAAPR